MKTGDKIRIIREDAKLSQEEFAELLKVTRQSVSKWESNKNYPELQKLILISQEYSVSVEYLLIDELDNPSSIEDKNSFEDFLRLHKVYIEHRDRRIYKFLNISILMLIAVQLVGIFVNMISYGSFLPEEAHLFYLNWDNRGGLEAISPNLFMIPVILLLTKFFINRFEHDRSESFKSIMVDKKLVPRSINFNKYNIKIYILLALINIIMFMRVVIDNLSIKTVTFVINQFAIPSLPLGNTLFPSYANMVEQIYSINSYVFILFFFASALQVYLIVNYERISNKSKYFCIAILIIIFVAMTFSNILLTSLLLLYFIGNAFITKILQHYYKAKPLLKLVIVYSVFSTVLIVLGLIIEYQSLGGFLQSGSAILMFAYESNDFLTIQSSSNVLLISTLLENFITFDGILLGGLILYVLTKLSNKIFNKGYNLKYIRASFYWFCAVTVLSSVILFGGFISLMINYVTALSNESTYVPDFSIKNDECFTDEYFDREMGNTILFENHHFVSCFDTSKGIYTVFFEVEDYGKKNIFDFYYEDIKYKRILVTNEEGNTILDYEHQGHDYQVFITTIDESLDGYSDIIVITYTPEAEDNSSTDIFGERTLVYDFDGQLIYDYSDVIFHIMHLKADWLFHGNDKFMFKGNVVYYVTLVDDEPVFWEHTIGEQAIEITVDEWRELTDELYGND